MGICPRASSPFLSKVRGQQEGDWEKLGQDRAREAGRGEMKEGGSISSPGSWSTLPATRWWSLLPEGVWRKRLGQGKGVGGPELPS